MTAHSHGQQDEDRREYTSAARETAARISARGVHLRGDETPTEIVALEEAIERFEQVVESRGGDLMMDEAPRGQQGEPDDPRFRLPTRTAAMSVAEYLVILSRAVDAMRRMR